MKGEALIGELGQRAGEGWLIGVDAQKLAELAESRFRVLQDWGSSQGRSTVLLLETEPLAFLANFVAACAAGFSVVLGNPLWSDAEQQQVLDLVQPQWIGQQGTLTRYEDDLRSPFPNLRVSQSPRTREFLGQCREQVACLSASPQQHWTGLGGFAKPLILIPTGGSSGQIRFAMHTWETLTASVMGGRAYFQIDRLHSCCVLPLFHVSGLMQFMRSFLTGGKLAIFSTKELEHQVQQIDPAEFFLSLVPTQLQRLLQNSENLLWLSRFHTILLGGAPAWTELLDLARSHHLRLAPTYGMSETASQVATLKPEDFLAGRSGAGQVLPHAKITIQGQKGESLQPGEIGTIVIQSHALFLGYYPTSDPLSPISDYLTDDLGYLDPEGYLHIVGRTSQKIITGGENVFPVEVESAIRATGLVSDVCVVGLPDRQWGEVIAAMIVPIAKSVSISALETALQSKLSRFKCPKRWKSIDCIPRNAQGKVNYEQIKAMFS